MLMYPSMVFIPIILAIILIIILNIIMTLKNIKKRILIRKGLLNKIPIKFENIFPVVIRTKKIIMNYSLWNPFSHYDYFGYLVINKGIINVIGKNYKNEIFNVTIDPNIISIHGRFVFSTQYWLVSLYNNKKIFLTYDSENYFNKSKNNTINIFKKIKKAPSEQIKN